MPNPFESTSRPVDTSYEAHVAYEKKSTPVAPPPAASGQLSLSPWDKIRLHWAEQARLKARKLRRQ